MAGGTVVLAHNSGGPKLDIVCSASDDDVTRVGFLAHDVASYAQAMRTIFELSDVEVTRIHENARDSVHRFSHENFERAFLGDVSTLPQLNACM